MLHSIMEPLYRSEKVTISVNMTRFSVPRPYSLCSGSIGLMSLPKSNGKGMSSLGQTGVTEIDDGKL